MASNYRSIARQKARKYGLDPSIFERQIGAESNFNPNARSPVGATGIAQIMPATARGWGVNPNDPVASLDAAAKNMAKYVKAYGSYENALRAYNAGPGAIEKSKGYRETNNYVAKILGGRDPGKLGSPSTKSVVDATRRSRTTGGSTRTTTTTTPAVPGTDNRREVLAQYLMNRNNPNALLSAVASLQITPGTPAASSSKTVRTPGAPVPSAAPSGSPAGTPSTSGGKGPGKLLELFWQGPNGINAKNGAKVPQGFVPGHDRHVHVAANTPENVVKLGRIAQEFGLKVGEQPTFGKVNQVHVPNSNHYANRAIDVTGDLKQLAAFARRVAKMYGVK